MTPPGFTPTWFNQLPQFRRGDPNRRVVIVDNQVLSYRLLDGRSGPVFDFLFQDARVIVQIARQVIDETLHSVGVVDTGVEADRRGRPRRVGPVVLGPGLPAELNQRMWEALAALQSAGRVFLAGLTQMTPVQRQGYDILAPLIDTASGRGMGPKDARVAADALVRQIPILSLDQRFKDAFRRALPDPALQAQLNAFGLTAFAPNLFVD
jgi:hypothetical protein